MSYYSNGLLSRLFMDVRLLFMPPPASSHFKTIASVIVAQRSFWELKELKEFWERKFVAFVQPVRVTCNEFLLMTCYVYYFSRALQATMLYTSRMLLQVARVLMTASLYSVSLAGINVIISAKGFRLSISVSSIKTACECSLGRSMYVEVYFFSVDFRITRNYTLSAQSRYFFFNCQY